MHLVLLLTPLLFAFAVATPAQAAPTGVVATLEFRSGATAIDGVGTTVVPIAVLPVGNFGPGGSFEITDVALGTGGPLPGTTYPFFDLFGDPAILLPGAFGPGLVGSGFGGSAPINGTLGTLRFDDGLGGVDVVARSHFALFGASDSGFLFDSFGYPVGFFSRGPWTTGTVTLAGSHPAAGGAFTTQLAGFDLRTPNGLGQLSMVSPLMLSDADTGADHPFFAVLDLEFVPEPAGAALALLGAGLLVVAARRR